MQNPCSPLSNPVNGRILPSHLCSHKNRPRIGLVCLYVCNRGYRVVGKARTKCTPNGWNAHNPICKGNFSVIQLEIVFVKGIRKAKWVKFIFFQSDKKEFSVGWVNSKLSQVGKFLSVVLSGTFRFEVWVGLSLEIIKKVFLGLAFCLR